ncbi:MAG: glycosyltransferase family 4 protein [Novosphingobium sp.]|nr:glycosyltransferase family 4 protein [Novosphingobium sp.]
MKIHISGRFAHQPMSGVQRYAMEIVRALDALVADGELPGDFELVTPVETPDVPLRAIPQVRHGTLPGHVWEQVSFARHASGGVALSLAMSGPVFHPRHVCVIHDAAIYRYPEHFSKPYVAAHSLIERMLARRATIATVSEFSRGELAECLKLPRERIVVAPNSADHLDASPDFSIIERLGLGTAPFFLTIGNLTRNKNLKVAVEALAQVPGDARLVVVGRIDQGVFATNVPEASSRVILAGRLSDEEVTALMRHARALVFPSLYEGFGIPPLEAMFNGCPVLASTAPAVQEVCADAAGYFAPHDAAALAALMRDVLADGGAWRAAMLEAGKRRVAQYHWSDSARIIAAACEALG